MKTSYITKYKKRILHECRMCHKQEMCIKAPKEDGGNYYCLDCWRALSVEI